MLAILFVILGAVIAYVAAARRPDRVGYLVVGAIVGLLVAFGLFGMQAFDLTP